MLHRRLNIFGKEFDIAVPQSGKGAPNENTPCCCGITYIDENSGDMYKCIRDGAGGLTWERIPCSDDLRKEINEALMKHYSGPVLLWKNDNPTMEFPAQIIPMDAYAYSMLICLPRETADMDMLSPAVILPVGGSSAYMHGFPGGKTSRRIVKASYYGVYFGDGQHFDSYGAAVPSTNNAHLIPTAIYGLGKLEVPDISAICGMFVCGSALCGE